MLGTKAPREMATVRMLAGVTQVQLEFTVEPFTAGEPGAHVLAAIAAAEALGARVEMGPFGTSATVATERVGETCAAVIDAALAAGASRVSVSVERG